MISEHKNKIKVGVIFGGRSGEHEVSLVSAKSVMGALDKDKYEIVPVGITKQGSWMVGVQPDALLESSKEGAAISFTNGSVAKASFNCDPSNRGLILLDQPMTEKQVKVDVLFPVVHGTNCEDGTLQGMMETADLPYVGCGVMASAVGMDKTVAKRLFEAAGLDIAPYVEILRSRFRKNPDAAVEEIESKLSYPCFIKPVNSGSSVGISKASNRQELLAGLEAAAKIDRKLLIEEAIDAREIEVSVLGNDEPIASLPGEIVPCNEFYDYKAKYIDNRSELNIPAKISESLIEEIREKAIIAYRALDCAGMARVDFFLEKKTGKVIINEINTIPGFTSISMYPKLWEATGLKYTDLVSKLIDLALERYQEKQESLSAVA